MVTDNVYWFAEDGSVQHMAVSGMYLNDDAYTDLDKEVVTLPIFSKASDSDSWYVLEDRLGRGFECFGANEIPESILLYRLLAGDG